MRLLKPKLIAPTAPPAGGQSHRWIAACLDYLRTECHLAVNTIAAYRRALAIETANKVAADSLKRLGG